MTDPLSAVYGRVVQTATAHGQVIPTHLAAAIFTFADTVGDTEMLVLLARTEGLAGDTRRRVAAHPKAAVRAAFLGRCDLTPEEADEIVVSETRVTVLASLASSTSVATALLTRLAAHPHHKVAVAALTNPRTPGEARLVAAVTMYAAWQKVRESTDRIKAAVIDAGQLDEHLEMLTEAAAQAATIEAARKLDAFACTFVCAGASGEAVRSWVAARAVAWLKIMEWGGHAPNDILRNLAALNTDPVTTAAILTAVTPILDRCRHDQYPPSFIRSFDRLGPPSGAVGNITRLDRIRSSCDPTELAAEAAAVLTETVTPARDVIVDALAAHPHLPETARRSLIGFTSRPELVRTLGLFSEVESFVAIATAEPSLTGTVLQATHDPATVSEQVAGMAAAHPNAEVQRRYVRELTSSPHATLAAIRLLPWMTLTTESGRWSAQVCAVIANEIGRLHGCPTVAAVFATLAVDYTGSFGELCDTAEALADIDTAA